MQRPVALLVLLLLCLLFARAANAFFHGDDIVPVSYRYTPDNWPEPLSADLYRPRDIARPPVVLVIHGGGWVKGSRDEGYVVSICQYLASHGMAALSVSYRLAPQSRFPAQLDDLAEALRWLAREGGALDLDTRRVGVWGYSAGAHLASLLSEQPQALPVAAVVAGGLPAELRVWPDSAMVLALLGQPRDSAPVLWTQASPVARVTPQTPPHFLYHGRLDRLVPYDQALMMQSALNHAGVPVTLYSRSYYGHILTALLPGETFEAATDFLHHYLPSPDPVAVAHAGP